MAKGNPFMGTVKGRIGDNVLYVSKGQQNVIKYQPNVTNPRTSPQVYQRARFSNAGRFYTRGIRSFFKFAFEGKKGSTSDFNAFMKANINRSALISKSALEVTGYPAVGKFIMTQGSLPTLRCRNYVPPVGSGYTNYDVFFNAAAPAELPTSVGGFSKVLIQSPDYQEGDILTFVFIRVTGSQTIPAVKPSNDVQTFWTVSQFRINVNDVTPLADFGLRADKTGSFGPTTTEQMIFLRGGGSEGMLNTPLNAFCAVHSRNVRGGLRVSTQELQLSYYMNQVWEQTQTDEYIQAVLANWREPDAVPVAREAILQGSMTTQQTVVSGVAIEPVATSQFVLNGSYFTAISELQPNTVYQVGLIKGTGISISEFTATQKQGDSPSSISFVQVDDDTVRIDLGVGGEISPANLYEIAMVKSGQSTVIANVVFNMAVDTVTISNNPQTIEIPGEGTGDYGTMNITPKLSAAVGDKFFAVIDFYINGAGRGYQVRVNTPALPSLDGGPIHIEQEGQSIGTPNILTIDEAYFYLDEEEMNYLHFEIGSLMSTSDSVTVTVKQLAILHADGTTDTYDIDA